MAARISSSATVIDKINWEETRLDFPWHIAAPTSTSNNIITSILQPLLVDGSEGYVALEWVCEKYLENVGLIPE